MTLPFSGQRIIMKALDHSQTLRPRNSDDVFPFLVALQDFGGESANLTTDSLLFVDFPHTLKCIYFIKYVKIISPNGWNAAAVSSPDVL